MTGEITLRGDVLPIGGIKEKVLAARRASIHRVILPAANRKDVEDLPAFALEDMRFDYVEGVDEVLAQAIHPAGKGAGGDGRDAKAGGKTRPPRAARAPRERGSEPPHGRGADPLDRVPRVAAGCLRPPRHRRRLRRLPPVARP